MGNGNGERKRRGGQFTSNLGPEWTGIAPHAVSKRESGTGEGSLGKRGIIKGIRQEDIKGIVPYALI